MTTVVGYKKRSEIRTISLGKRKEKSNGNDPSIWFAESFCYTLSRSVKMERTVSSFIKYCGLENNNRRRSKKTLI